LVVDGYDGGGGDVRVVEKGAQSTMASLVEGKGLLLPLHWDEWEEVEGEEVLVNSLTLVDGRSKGEKIILPYS